MKGYFNVPRKFLDGRIWQLQDLRYFRGLMYIFGHVCYSEYTWNFHGQTFCCPPMSFVITQEQLAADLGMSRQAVRSFLNVLEEEKIINQRTRQSVGTLVTVVDRDFCQCNQPKVQPLPCKSIQKNIQNSFVCFSSNENDSSEVENKAYKNKEEQNQTGLVKAELDLSTFTPGMRKAYEQFKRRVRNAER